MLKPLLFVGAAVMALPAIAQEAPPAPDPAPTSEPMAEEPEATTPDSTAAHENSGAAASSAQIAAIVEKDFAGYDADANSELNQGEFASWMTALKSSTEPGFDGTTPEAQAWMGKAFAAADTDKSSAVSKGELTAFLSRSAG